MCKVQSGWLATRVCWASPVLRRLHSRDGRTTCLTSTSRLYLQLRGSRLEHVAGTSCLRVTPGIMEYTGTHVELMAPCFVGLPIRRRVARSGSLRGNPRLKKCKILNRFHAIPFAPFKRDPHSPYVPFRWQPIIPVKWTPIEPYLRFKETFISPYNLYPCYRSFPY